MDDNSPEETESDESPDGSDESRHNGLHVPRATRLRGYVVFGVLGYTTFSSIYTLVSRYGNQSVPSVPFGVVGVLLILYSATFTSLSAFHLVYRKDVEGFVRSLRVLGVVVVVALPLSLFVVYAAEA
ncbi:MAG: hypothetical protein SV760_07870 [Halobacteria archaeon]|nr:hypothetical protein [Halobacteria archaeon]